MTISDKHVGSWSGTQIRVMPKHVTFDHLVGSESPKQNIE
jgi:hypothetical protein